MGPIAAVAASALAPSIMGPVTSIVTSLLSDILNPGDDSGNIEDGLPSNNSESGGAAYFEEGSL